MDEKLLKLVNPEFAIEFAGKSYTLRKANLEKAVLYQQKVKELIGDPAAHMKIVAFCIFLMLRDTDPAITEDFVAKNTPADIDPLEILATLGFISPQKLEITSRLQNKKPENSTSENSSGQ